jgi:hypothetical protein
MLLEKLEIVLNGARKRNNDVLVGSARARRQRYRRMLEQLEATSMPGRVE